MPLERDVAIVLVVEVLHLLCPSGGTAHHGDEPRGTGTLLWGVGGGGATNRGSGNLEGVIAPLNSEIPVHKVSLLRAIC